MRPASEMHTSETYLWSGGRTWKGTSCDFRSTNRNSIQWRWYSQNQSDYQSSGQKPGSQFIRSTWIMLMSWCAVRRPCITMLILSFLISGTLIFPVKLNIDHSIKSPNSRLTGDAALDGTMLTFKSFWETIVQMDSVIGRVGGKCLLTIHFVETSLMLAFLRDANTSGSVTRIINLLDKVLGAKTFSRLLPVILTDNGS